MRPTHFPAGRQQTWNRIVRIRRIGCQSPEWLTVQLDYVDIMNVCKCTIFDAIAEFRTFILARFTLVECYGLRIGTWNRTSQTKKSSLGGSNKKMPSAVSWLIDFSCFRLFSIHFLASIASMPLFGIAVVVFFTALLGLENSFGNHFIGSNNGFRSIFSFQLKRRKK